MNGACALSLSEQPPKGQASEQADTPAAASPAAVVPTAPPLAATAAPAGVALAAAPTGGALAAAPAAAPAARQTGGISPEMRKKLLGESVGLGGLPEKPMPSNIFLNIILGVTALVIVAYVGGIRP